MLLSQFMNASNLARDLGGGLSDTVHGLNKAADALEARATFLRSEADRFREAPRSTIGAEQRKTSILLGVQSLADTAHEISAQADLLAASANSPEVGVSSRMIASALGVSTNTAIKRIRNASQERTGDG